MPRGFAIVQVDIHDPARYEDYRTQTEASLAPFDGRFIVRGGPTECVEGTWDAQRTVVIEFPSIDQARDWYRSDRYQQIAAIRREASDANFVLVEGVG